MHYPIRFLAMWCSPFVEHKCLPHTNSRKATVDDLIPASGFPETGSSGTIRSGSRWVLLVFVTKKVPIILRGGSYLALL